MIITLLTFLALTMQSAAPKAVGLTVSAFVLSDQYDKEWSWKEQGAHNAIIMMLIDRDGSTYLDKWTAPISARFGDRLRVIRIANTSGAPGFLHSFIKGRFRKSFSYPMLLDWEGVLFSRYHIREAVPNILFVDAHGKIRLHTWGKGDTLHVSTVINKIADLLQAATPEQTK